jgi:hypothetical protein
MMMDRGQMDGLSLQAIKAYTSDRAGTGAEESIFNYISGVI